MEKIISDVLDKLEDNSYESYVVGGYVRDYLLGIKSYDIDITTKARPKEVLELFPTYDITIEDYGNVSFEESDWHLGHIYQEIWNILEENSDGDFVQIDTDLSY